MKKIIVAVLGVLLFSPAVFADNWGLGLKLGGGENDPKDMKKTYDSYLGSKELDKSGAYFGLEALYEWNMDDINKIGAKIGLDTYGENKVELKGAGDVKEDTYAFPLSVYFKQDYGIKNWSWFAGAGATIIRTKIDNDLGSNFSKTKVFPHILVGGEYRFTKLFALGLEARYNFSAKVKKNGLLLSDRSGFGAALTGRFYF